MKESWSVSDSVLHQLTERLARATPESDATETIEDHVAFGWSRGVKERNYYIEFRKSNGSITALPYMMLERVDFDPSEGITLKFTTQTVRLIGRNLNAEVRPNVVLFNGILRNKVPWVQESGSTALLAAGKHATVIESIEY